MTESGRMSSRAVVGLCLVSLWGCPAFAQEQTAGEAAAVPSTAAAAEAYDRGSAFYLNGDFARAAEWFETAYRLAPAPPALMQAIRAQVRAGERLGAANLALRLGGLHGDHPEASALADEVIADTAGEFVRLGVDCECQLEIEQRIWSFPAAFLAPGVPHRVIVSHGEDREVHTVIGEAGQHVVLGAPPESPVEAPPVEVPIVEDPPIEVPVVEDPPVEVPVVLAPPIRGGLSPWLFGIGVGLTAVSGALLIWSGVDTLAGVDAFNRMPTPEGFEQGEAKEARTNVLIGTTLGLGLLSAILAIFTEWDSEESSPTGGVTVHENGGGIWLRGVF